MLSTGVLESIMFYLYAYSLSYGYAHSIFFLSQQQEEVPSICFDQR